MKTFYLASLAVDEIYYRGLCAGMSVGHAGKLTGSHWLPGNLSNNRNSQGFLPRSSPPT